MFGPTHYLLWARRFFGQARFDLATSGITSPPASDLGFPGGADVDDPRGWTQLREAIAAHNAVDVGEAIAALGTSHALWMAYASLLEPGDEVLVEDPTYEPLLSAAKGVGAHVVRFERTRSERFALNPERVARAMTPRTRVIAITNLHNPSGARADGDALRALAGVAASRGAFLLVDEVYAAFDSFVDTHGAFQGSARKLAPNVVTVSSLTKCYGLGTHRIGWLLGPRDVVQRAEHVVTATCGMLPLSHSYIALRAFARINDLALRSRSLLADKRVVVDEWARAQRLDWSAPAEGIFGFAIIPGAGDLTATIEAAARDHQVLVVPGSFFGVSNGFRLAWSAPREMLDEGLRRLTEVLRDAVAQLSRSEGQR
jgi:aspartate/methionine/tyrosine aminotransferase